jgi:PAS domain S-box-containing protein
MTALDASYQEFSAKEREWIENNPKVIVGGESDWPPFDYVQAGEYRGIAKDYLDLIAQKSGLVFEIKTGYSWSELLEMAKERQIDLLPMIYISNERKKYLHFTKPYLSIRHYLYTVEERDYQSLEDLFGKRVAVPKGFAQAEILRQHYPQIEVFEAGNSLDCIDAVVTKRADALIENTALVAYYIKTEGIKGIKAAFPTDLGVNHLHMATRKDQKILRDIIQKALDAIEVEEKKAIYAKWVEPTQSHQYFWHIVAVALMVLALLLLFTYLLNRKIKQEVKKQTNLQKYLQNLTNNTFDAITTIDHSGRVLTWNKACERIFGYSYEEIKGKNLHQTLMPSELMEQHLRGFLYFKKSGKGPLVGKVLEVEGLDKKGVRIPIEISVNAISYEDKWHALGIIRDLRDRKHLESQVQEISRQKQEIDSILNGSSTILIVNNGKEMVRANQAFVDFFEQYDSYELFKAKHSCICDFFEPVYEEGYIYQKSIEGDYWISYLSKQNNRNFKVAIFKNGYLHHFFIHVSSITLNEQPFYLIELIDITLEKELELELTEARDSAQKASEAKSLFLANMSHEIRTPLNGIIGLTNIVLQSQLQEQQRNYLSKVKTSSHALLSVINDVLDYSKIEAHKFTLEKMAFNFDELLYSIKDLFGYRMDQKGIRLLFDVDKTIPHRLIGDKSRIIQVLNNLVGNAVKFTDSGSIEVKMKRLATDNQKAEIEFCIKDSGIGIDKADQIKLFKPFSQVDSSHTKAYRGTGLGLVITKEIVELMDGKITFSSKKGVGSEFCFRIALEYIDQVPVEPIKPKEQRQIRFKAEVLIVEDDEVNQIVACEYLRSYGVSVSIANNGQEAVQKVQQQHFDMVFMDLQMPVMDGFSATKKMRQMGIETPVIALSAAVMKADKELTKEARMDGHIAKPLKRKELEAILCQYLEYEEIKETPKTTPHPLKLTLYGIEFEALLDSLGFEQETIYSMLLNFAYSYSGFADEIASMQPKSQEYEQAIHKLKGVSGNLKATKLYELALALEHLNIHEAQQVLDALLKELDKVISSILDTVLPLTQLQQDEPVERTTALEELESIAKDIEADNFVASTRIDTLMNDLDNFIDNQRTAKLKEAFLDYNYESVKIMLSEIKEEIDDE